jgi:hypothetical protein
MSGTHTQADHERAGEVAEQAGHCADAMNPGDGQAVAYWLGVLRGRQAAAVARSRMPDPAGIRPAETNRDRPFP